ncbi:hypothetical protein ACFS7Z_13825 [Pontibacter toksunensis]|uniref:Uncharacterized protein n=1 Tax=Pontibacter toksunensis TaxID=1332631 RepID=A0ABW6BWG1_9BACT
MLFNLVTFFIGTFFSLSQIPQSVMVTISFRGSLEVCFYGALGGIASIIAKLAAEYCIKRFVPHWDKQNNQTQK